MGLHPSVCRWSFPGFGSTVMSDRTSAALIFPFLQYSRTASNTFFLFCSFMSMTCSFTIPSVPAALPPPSLSIAAAISLSVTSTSAFAPAAVLRPGSSVGGSGYDSGSPPPKTSAKNLRCISARPSAEYAVSFSCVSGGWMFLVFFAAFFPPNLATTRIAGAWPLLSKWSSASRQISSTNLAWSRRSMRFIAFKIFRAFCSSPSVIACRLSAQSSRNSAEIHGFSCFSSPHTSFAARVTASCSVFPDSVSFVTLSLYFSFFSGSAAAGRGSSWHFLAVPLFRFFPYQPKASTRTWLTSSWWSCPGKVAQAS
mmetsp:Transcript_24955/g.62765  ORF Transcript_24955/g.62765 Transcript_24955/m.62765 type:complete len:311 (-) Transcript_24955:1087-2019(-)